MELRGLEPLASCMPSMANPSGIVRDSRVRPAQSRPVVRQGLEPTGVGWARSHWISHWPRGGVERRQLPASLQRTAVATRSRHPRLQAGSPVPTQASARPAHRECGRSGDEANRHFAKRGLSPRVELAPLMAYRAGQCPSVRCADAGILRAPVAADRFSRRTYPPRSS